MRDEEGFKREILSDVQSERAHLKAELLRSEEKIDALSAQNARLREALSELDRELEEGFVRCERCGGQEDLATLDCRKYVIAPALALPELPSVAVAREEKNL